MINTKLVIQFILIPDPEKLQYMISVLCNY